MVDKGLVLGRSDDVVGRAKHVDRGVPTAGGVKVGDRALVVPFPDLAGRVCRE